MVALNIGTFTALVSLIPLIFSYRFGFNGMKTGTILKGNQLVNNQINIKSSKLLLTNDPFASYNELYPTRQQLQSDRILSTELQSTLSSLSMENPVVSIEVEDVDFPALQTLADDDSFIQSLDFAKSVADMTSSVFRMDVLMAMVIIFPNIDNFVQFVTSSVVHNQVITDNILPAMALYFGNILFFIFL